MPSVQVKNVPPAVHAELSRRARARGISLQDYVLQLLVEDADATPLDEIFDAIERGEGGRSGGSFTFRDTVEAIHEGREERDRR
jgi:hypothetical protein